AQKSRGLDRSQIEPAVRHRLGLVAINQEFRQSKFLIVCLLSRRVESAETQSRELRLAEKGDVMPNEDLTIQPGSSQTTPDDREHASGEQPACSEIDHRHDCGNLFGCGDELGTGILREDIKDAALTARTSDRLLHMDEISQERLDGYL